MKSIIESLLFVSETPLTVNQLKTVLDDHDSADIKAALETLISEYQERNGGFVIREVAGGYQFRTCSRHSPWIRRLLKPSASRLSRAAMETLAIVAYHQPIIRTDIEHIRGVDSGGVLRLLMDRKLVRVLGRKEIPGRPLIYATTRHFLEVFELRDLKDLPTLNEIESLGPAEMEAVSDEVENSSEPDVLAEAPSETEQDEKD
ncbi:SMC-Scp complex subunit ScpB [Desulfosarcina sp. OttesenSCG-928-A07]|nr:SMC-Scp complex subunit ScpB [Desulfosarcina sp. OttesenSCG-928-A07]